MAEHDYIIDNQSAPAFRADLNNALQAIVSQNSKGTAPSVTYANMFWYDTASNWLFARNETNSAWIRFAFFDQATNRISLVDDTSIVNTSGAQVGLLGDQSTGTWQAGTGTTQSLVSPANVKAAILALTPPPPSSVPTTEQVAAATAGIGAGAVGSYMAAAGPGNQNAAFGATISGTVLRPTSFLGVSGSLQGGTWRSMGNLSTASGGNGTLFLRIS